MNCPGCGKRSEVIDSRASAKAVRRRRRCTTCDRRFTTVEYVPPEVGTLPAGRIPPTDRLAGVAAVFNLRVHARFVDGQLQLTVPPQEFLGTPQETLGSNQLPQGDDDFAPANSPAAGIEEMIDGQEPTDEGP